MGYTYVEDSTNGDINANYCLEVNVMGEDDAFVSDSELDEVYDGITYALDQIYEAGKVDGTLARKYKTDNVIDCSNRYNDGNQWLDDNGFSGEDGQYLWVADCNGSSSAAWGAWEGRTQAFVSTRDWSGYRLAVVGIQEGLHAYLKKNCKYVESELGGANGEHDLGHESYGDNHSPLCATYPDSVVVGTCDNGDKADTGWTRHPSSCTNQAIEDSWKHAKYDGSH